MAEQRAAPYLFISYASADRDRVLPVVAALERAGISVWIDREGIAGGENYGTVIADAVKGSAAVLVMASASSLASRNVKQEIALGWRFERPYLPLLLEAVAIPDDLAYWLEAAQWIEVLDRHEGTWLPAVLAALAPLGIEPVVPQHEATRLAGRERELGLLREKLASAKGGRGGLVIIGGEAGVGKTTLAEEALHEAAQQGFLLLEGHCFDLAETPPYGPWIDLFAHYAPSPSWPSLPEAFAQRGTVGAVASQMALFVAVEDFLTALATRQPICVLLDDLHWADPASLDLLRFLTRSVATLPLLILVTYRSDELTRRHPLYQLLPQLAREASTARLDLGRLDDDAVQTLIDGRYGLPDGDAARLVTYLQSRAEGNALFLGELLRALEEAGTLRRDGETWRLDDLTATAVPALLRQVIDGRAARLDAESRRLLGVAAVIGHEVPLDVWAAVGEVGEDALLAVVEQGLEALLLVDASGDDAVRFAHALIREALYEGIPGVRRRRMHRRIGETLAAARNPDPDAVAYHFLQDGDARTAEWLVRAGERAQGASAWLTAAERFQGAVTFLEERGIDEAKRGWLLFRIARLCRYANPARSVAQLEAAEWIARSVGDRALAACAVLERGGISCAMGECARGLADLRAGVAMEDALPDDERARLGKPDTTGGADLNHRGVLALWLAFTGHFAEARSSAEQVLAQTSAAPGVATQNSLDPANASYALGFVHVALGEPDDAWRAFADGRDKFLAVGHHYLGGIAALQELSCLLHYRPDHRTECQRLAAEAEEAWVLATGSLDTLDPRLAYAPLLFIQGSWDEARALALAVRESSQSQWSYVMLAIGLLGLLARHQGDAALAWTLVRDELPEGLDTPPGTKRYAETLALQELAAALSTDACELTTARAWLEVHDRWVTWGGTVLGKAEGQVGWAAYHRVAGETARAREHAERALAHATEPRQPLALIAAHRLLGELDTKAGRHDDAGHHLDASLALADACQAPFERALTLLAMAELRAAMGEHDAARTLLDEVKAVCEPLGAKPTLARVDALGARLT